jgi:hypothetical protein
MDDYRLEDIINKISLVDYADNNFNNTYHEDNVEEILVKNNIVKSKKQNKDNKNLHFIKHPNGKQNTPDFRLYIEGKSIDIECKSSRTGYKPMYNATYPDKDTIYVYTNKKDNNTIIYYGSEIISDEVRDICEEYKLLNKKLHNEINKKLELLDSTHNPYGMRVYARNMFVQTRNLDVSKKNEYIKNIKNKNKNEK